MDRIAELLKEAEDFRDGKRFKTFPLEPYPVKDVEDTLRLIVHELELGRINVEEAYAVTQAMDWHMPSSVRYDPTVKALKEEIGRRLVPFIRIY